MGNLMDANHIKQACCTIQSGNLISLKYHFFNEEAFLIASSLL